MDYVAMLSFRSSASAADRDAALMRRAGWQYPSGTRMIVEYWPASGTVQVVSIFSADEFAGVMELVFEWSDVFEVNVHPAISAEEGLQVGAGVLARLPRLQK